MARRSDRRHEGLHPRRGWLLGDDRPARRRAARRSASCTSRRSIALFFATPDGGAYVAARRARSTPLAVSTVAAAADVRLVASASHRSPDLDRVKSELGIDNEHNVGSVGVKLCLIAMGVRDLYVNPAAKTKAWDTCAPEAILVRAGGRLSDLFGGADRLHAELRAPSRAGRVERPRPRRGRRQAGAAVPAAR